MAAFQTILASDFAVQIIYPFLLIFTLIFAILQRSKILGEGKYQIDALVSLSIALIVVAFSWATGIIVNLMPFLAISVVVILVFLILYGFVASTSNEGLKLSPGLQITFGVLAAIVVVIALVVATGQWNNLYNALFVGGSPTGIASNIFIIAVIIGAIILVVFSSRSKKS